MSMMPMPSSRKISVSFVSEALPTNSNEPFQPHQGRRDPALKNLQQKLLRLQVLQVMLSLTLLVLSAVAIIEERILCSLGFGLVSAIISILCSVVGIQQSKPKMVFLVTVIALCSLLPAFYYTLVSLSYNIQLRTGTLSESDPGSGITTTPDPSSPPMDDHRGSTTVWILGWLELMHLLPLAASLSYSLFILKYLHYHHYSL